MATRLLRPLHNPAKAMKNSISDLDALWNSVTPVERVFEPGQVAHLPDAVQTYLTHAIAPGTLLASAVRLRMHGVIKLGRYRKFKAEQVIVRGRSMIWRAKLRIHGLSVRGYDRFVDGAGEMRWKMMRVIPLVHATGVDVTRSASGRVAAESIWLPSFLCDASVWWRAGEAGVAHARFAVDGHAAELALRLDQGRVRSIAMSRWGNPDGQAFHEASFGAFVDQEATFGGYTIPARLRVGWYVDDSARFDAEGKFLEVSIDDAVYR